ncbi:MULTISPECIES: HalOD1 output domain-containing protein [Halorussus]|uniref:HalOD1 output domain-containing protein n=1 Tax=Halorussus TaxID=1070314 RepID=UPI000E217B75|nr:MULTISPECIES: HalOD1 output domain-containing protein [Halorussus]NHN60485.1 hypothetical protein [Halorussus sp. JP-T4]
MPAHTLDTPADSVTQDVVAAVADATGRAPETLPPLYDVVDPDALEALANRPPRVGRRSAGLEVTFDFADCVVTVSSGDGVAVSADPADAVAPR